MSEFLSKLEKTKNWKRSKKRIGRGGGSGKGSHTTIKGNKGQKSRSGGKTKIYFEGGQMPLVRRLPYRKGFNNINSKEYVTFNLSDIERIAAKYKLTEISPTSLAKSKAVKLKKGVKIKILSRGSLSKKIDFKGVEYSKKTLEKLGNTG